MTKLVPGKNDFATKYKELAKEWDEEKNSPVRACDVFSCETTPKRHWKCSLCDYEWEATVRSRASGKRGCPECAKRIVAEKIRKKAIEKNGSLYDNYPKIAEEWDYTLNAPLTPKDVPSGSKERVWWKCLKNKKHPPYPAVIYDKVHKKTACPTCTNRKISYVPAVKKLTVGKNDLATLRSDIAKEWNYEKNEGKTPEMFTVGSSKIVWWKCSFCGYEWQVSISNRTSKMGSGCKKCNGRAQSSFPEQTIYYYVRQMYPDAINGYHDDFLKKKELDVFIPSLRIAIEYDGKVFHRGKFAKENEKEKYMLCKQNHITLLRIKETSDLKQQLDNEDCDICILTSERPDFDDLKQMIKNIGQYIKMPNDVDLSRDGIAIKSQYLSILRENSLEKQYPELAAEWDYKENAPLTPAMFFAKSGDTVHWKCRVCGGGWTAKIYTRAQGNGCPYCAGQKVLPGRNDLKTNYPAIAALWDYQLNKEGPESVTPGSNKKKYWICSECGKSYLQSPKQKIRYQSSICNECERKTRTLKIWETRRKNGTTKSPTAKRVGQFTLDGELIAVYDSAYQAAEKLGIKRKGISDNANGRQKTYAGYVWKHL